jgi:hypothetical protein
MRYLVCTSAALAASIAWLPVMAEWSVYDRGIWPKIWPTQLERLRETSRSIQGGQLEIVVHNVPFSNRDEFESAWPNILKVKTKGAPIVLVRSPGSHWHFGKTKAGVLIHCPPGGVDREQPAERTIRSGKRKDDWLWTTYLELVVDGEIVNLNRIQLPADTPIIDERFEELKASGELQ